MKYMDILNMFRRTKSGDYAMVITKEQYEELKICFKTMDCVNEGSNVIIKNILNINDRE